MVKAELALCRTKEVTSEARFLETRLFGETRGTHTFQVEIVIVRNRVCFSMVLFDGFMEESLEIVVTTINIGNTLCSLILFSF